MYEKDLSVPILLDFYGELLTGKQRDAVRCYYEDDMSLGEIAENSGISRQGVRDSIKRGEEQLRSYEERLGLAARFSETLKKLSGIRESAELIKSANQSAGRITEISDRADEILRAVDEID